MELGTEAEGLRASRRNVVRGAAWSVPVVAVATAAPAFAASPCDTRTYTIDWGNAAATTYTRPSQTGSGALTGTAIALAPAGSGSSNVAMTLTSTVDGSVTRAVDNMAVSAETNVGGLNLGPGLNLSHAAPVTSGSGNRQNLSMSFDRAVTGLSFWITDIDSTRNGSGTNRDPYSGWWDRVALSGTYDQARDPLVLGTGAGSTPWYFNDVDTNVGNETSGARVRVTYPGTIAAGATITLQYWTTQSGGNQRIFLSDMTFNAKGC